MKTCGGPAVAASPRRAGLPKTPGRCYAGGHPMDSSTLATATALAAPGAAPLALAVVTLVLLVGLLALTRSVGKR